MWSFYDTMIDAVDDSRTISDYTVGAEWCMVLADDGSAGLSRVRHEKWQRFSFGVDIKQGMPLSEAAAAVRSWNPYEAALGLAAINAFYNRDDRLTEGAFRYPGGRRSRGVFRQFCEEHTKGKRTLMIEPHYDREELAGAPGLIDITRLETSYRDHRFNAYEELVPQADALIISGIAIESKLAGPAVRDAKSLGKDILMWGPDVPLAPGLAAHGISEIEAFIVEDGEKCMWTVKRAGGRDDILRLGHFAKEKL